MLNRLIIALAALLATSLVQAHGTHAGTIHVEQAQARASVGNQANGAAFLTIENQVKADDERLDLKAGEKIEMKPGQGYHIMLMGLKKPLKAGDSFPMQLSFRKAGKVQLTVTVMEAGTASKSGQDEQMHQHHGHQ